GDGFTCFTPDAIHSPIASATGIQKPLMPVNTIGALHITNQHFEITLIIGFDSGFVPILSEGNDLSRPHYNKNNNPYPTTKFLHDLSIHPMPMIVCQSYPIVLSYTN